MKLDVELVKFLMFEVKSKSLIKTKNSIVSCGKHFQSVIGLVTEVSKIFLPVSRSL